MKKALLSLLAVLFYCGFAVMPVLAEQTIIIDADPGDNVYGNGDQGNNGYWDGVGTDGLNDPNMNTVIVSSNVSGYVYGAIYGVVGSSGSAAADSNSVTVNDGIISRSVYGGYIGVIDSSGSAAVNNNSVTINGGSINSYVYGGRAYVSYASSGFAAANNNSVTINSGVTITSGNYNISYVYGGYASTGNGSAEAGNNSVTINGGNIEVDLQVYGGHASASNGSAEANINSVTVTSGSLSSVYGGYASVNNGSAEANINSVTVTSGSLSSVYGGYANAYNDSFSEANNNNITINGGSIEHTVHGGYASAETSGSAAANNNGIIINGGNIHYSVGFFYCVSGGYAYADTFGFVEANNNEIIINGGSINYTVHGGYAEGSSGIGSVTANINNNSVTVNDGNVFSVSGGRACSYIATVNNNNVTVNGGSIAENVSGGEAFKYGAGGGMLMFNNNSVTINDGSIAGNVYGGIIYTDDAAVAAGNNSVIINGGNISGDVYGVYIHNNADGTRRNAVHNTITLSGAPIFALSGGIYGGGIAYAAAGNDAFTGNTLNVRDYSGLFLGSVQNFEYYNFVFPVTHPGVVLVVSTATLSDGAGRSSIVTAGTHGGKDPLAVGTVVTLIYALDYLDDTNFTQTQAEGMHGAFLRYLWELDTAGDNLTAKVLKVDAIPQAKILSEGVAAGAILAGQGAENINSALLNGLQEGKIEAIASVFGGSSKYDTGSSVDMSMFGAALGAAKKFGSFDAGVFIEYASGSFDTQYSGLKGDGEATAIGVGILAKKDVNENVYVEGLIRGGQASNDYKTKVSSANADFDYSSMYFGFSLGAGRIFEISEKINVDAYGKYTLTSIGSGDADLPTGNKYEFDSILSNRIKAGAKGEYKISETIKPYLALSYDYELSGDINAKIEGYEVEAPSLNGGTLSGGLGLNTKIAEKLTLDLSANVYSGVREGVTGNLQVKYQF